MSATSGTLATNAATSVRVSLSASANALAPGSYSDTVSFTNLAPGLGSANCPITLSVTVHPVVQFVNPHILDDGSIRMTLQGVDNGVYSILASPDLLDQVANWTEVLRVTNTSGQTVFTISPPRSSPQYYRAKEH